MEILKWDEILKQALQPPTKAQLEMLRDPDDTQSWKLDAERRHARETSMGERSDTWFKFETN